MRPRAVRGSTLPAGRSLPAGELAALFAACADDTAGGTRGAAHLAVLYAGGLRRAESVALDLNDYDADTGTLTLLRGKGRKAREVYLAGGCRTGRRRVGDVRGDEPGTRCCAL